MAALYLFHPDSHRRACRQLATAVADANDAEVAYLISDHLGSPRVNTDKNGNVTARHDDHPPERRTTLVYRVWFPESREAAKEDKRREAGQALYGTVLSCRTISRELSGAAFIS